METKEIEANEAMQRQRLQCGPDVPKTMQEKGTRIAYENNTANEAEHSSNTRNFQQSLTNPVNRSMYLTKVDVSEVHKIVQGFGNKATQDTKIEALKIANTS